MDKYIPIPFHQTQPFPPESAPVRQPPNALRTLVGVSLGAAAALAVDFSPVLDWIAGLL